MTTKEMVIAGAKIGVAAAVGKLTYSVVDAFIGVIVLKITDVTLAGESKNRKERKMNHESDNNRS